MRSSRPCLAPCVLLCALMALGHSASAQNAASNSTVAFAAATFNALPSVGAVTITVNRSGDTSGPVIVTYTTIDGSAVAGTDYDSAVGTLSWASGDGTPKSFVLPIAGADPGNRSFSVALLSASGANFGSPPSAAVVIAAATGTAPAVPPTAAPSVAFAAENFAAVASAGAAIVSVNRYGDSTGPAIVTYTTLDGTAIAGTDYSATIGTLSWAGGDSTPKSFSVPITTTDAVYNSFVVALTSASGANFAEPLEATVTISDSSSSSSGASTSVPAPAASVGYNTNTFNSTTIAADGGPWLLDNFYGQSTNAGQVVQEANGSMSFPGTTGTVGMVSTAHLDSSKPNNWAGLAFGGGAYMEATLSMVGEYVGDYAASWPAWWSSDIERAAYNGVSSNYPGVQWQGQAAEFQHYIEVDFLEFDVNPPTIGTTIHDWSGMNGSQINVQKALFPSLATYDTSSAASLAIGCLWVPATATTKGYLNLYLNRVLVGTVASWNQYNPADAPAANDATTGTNALSAFSVLDTRHLALIIGNQNPAMPINVTNVQVWQASSADNITQ